MMSGSRQNAPATRAEKAAQANRDHYNYISGFVKARELRLLDQMRLNRLLEAADPDDIGRVLVESGYPARPHPEEMLRAETIDLLTWLRQLMPDPGYADALMVFHDGHNLKLALKKLLTIWLTAQPEDAKTADERSVKQNLDKITRQNSASGLPDFSAADGIPPPGDILPLTQLPAQVEPAALYHLVAEHRMGELPEWIGKSALAAIRCYLQRYDLGDVDLLIDQQTWHQAHQLAAATGNVFFRDWLRWRCDLINLDLLLRTRILRSGRSTLERALLPGGGIAAWDVLDLYGEADEAVRHFYIGTPYRELADLVQQYARPGQAAHFGRMADNWLMSQLREIRWVISGPEVPLAWVFARQAEIKNVRIILTCLRNGLPRTMAQDLIRDSFLAWR